MGVPADGCGPAQPTGRLDELPVGRAAEIVSVAGDDSLVQRLLEMGLIEGEPVEVVGFAPLGDPMHIRLRDYRLSLRRAEARCITIRQTMKSER